MEEARGDAGLRAAAAIALLASVALLGCGGDDGAPPTGPLSKADYERYFKQTLARADDPVATPAESSPEALAESFAQARERALRAASELEGLKPPAEVAAPHRDYIAAMRSVASDLDEVIALARKGEADELRRRAERPTGQLSPRTAELARRARSGFAEKGYDVGLESGAATP